MSMTYDSSPFHKIRGVKIWVLLAITLLYSAWFTTIGPYGQLAGLAPGLPLEERGYYTGAQAVETLSQLDGAGQRTKYLSLACDIPFMILWALCFEALIAFGLRRLQAKGAAWNMLFILPLAFLLIDFAEDSFIALTLASGSETLGAVAGIMTLIKMPAFMAAAMAGLGLGVTGLIFWLLGRRSRS